MHAYPAIQKYAQLARECAQETSEARVLRDEAIARERAAGGLLVDLAAAASMSIAAVQRIATREPVPDSAESGTGLADTHEL